MTAPIRTHAVSRWAGRTACIVGVTVLTGYFADIDILTRVVPHKAQMAPVTAVCFLLLGTALARRAAALASASSTIDPWIVGTASVAALVGLSTIAGYVWGAPIGYEAWILPAVGRAGFTVGRMAETSSISVTLLGASILCSSISVRFRSLSQSLAIAVSVLGLLAVAGYLYDAKALYAMAGFTSMALPTALLSLILGIDTLAVEPRGWFVAPILSHLTGGASARRLLPAALLVPLSIGWLRLQGELLGLYGTAVGLALFASANVLVFVTLAWWNARQLNEIDAHSEQADTIARNALSESEKRYRSIAESLPQLVWTCGADGQCDYLSPQWRAYTGIADTDQLRSWSPQVLPSDLTAAEGQWAWSMASGDTFDTEVRIRRADGVYRWFRTMAVPLRDENGQIVKWFGTSTDIDDRKRAEAELQELTIALERRVDDRTRELRIAKEQAESADRLKTDFLMTMSHELRTPLNGIIGFTSTLLTRIPGPLTDQQETQLRIVQSSGRQLLLIISEVLDVAQIESGAYAPVLGPVDVGNLLRTVAAEMEPLARDKRLEIIVDTPADPILMQSDARALRQVLTNLTSNAIKFTPQGTVTLSALANGSGASPHVELSVADTGIGIASVDRSRLFTKFGRLKDPRHSSESGTGLGLYLCHRLVSFLQGSIELESEPDRGSRFTVRLPVTPREVR